MLKNRPCFYRSDIICHKDCCSDCDNFTEEEMVQRAIDIVIEKNLEAFKELERY